MATITLKGNPVNTISNLPSIGSDAYNFTLTNAELTSVSLNDYKGKKVLLNIFPSLDTSTCAASVRKFNERAASLQNVTVLCISKDLPFAQKRFCVAENINNVETLSEYKTSDFGIRYGVLIMDGPLEGLFSRAVVIVNEKGKVIYTEQVPEISQEPDYEKAISALI